MVKTEELTPVGSVQNLINMSVGMVREYKNVRAGRSNTFSLNVAEHCPVGCDCYWKRDRAPMAARFLESQGKAVPQRLNDHLAIGKSEMPPIMTPEEMGNFVEERKKEGKVVCFAVGGEPYANIPGLIEVVTRITTVIGTSGTSPLRQFPSEHFVSVDGATAETHNKVRRSSGLFERLTENIANAREQFDRFPVMIHFVANAINYKEIPEVLGYWSTDNRADGLYVSTATKIGRDGGFMQLSDGQQEEVVGLLLEAQKNHPKFLRASTSMIEGLHPENLRKQKPDNCGTAIFSPSYDGWGKLIPQCILGPEADCSTCGCVVTLLTKPLVKVHELGYIGLKDVSTFLVANQLVPSQDQLPKPDPTREYRPAVAHQKRVYLAQ